MSKEDICAGHSPWNQEQIKILSKLVHLEQNSINIVELTVDQINAAYDMSIENPNMVPLQIELTVRGFKFGKYEEPGWKPEDRNII